MQQLVIEVQDRDLSFFTGLLSRFDSVKIIRPLNGAHPLKKRRTKEQLEFIEDLKQSLLEVQLHQQGKIELQTADELIEELWPSSSPRLVSESN